MSRSELAKSPEIFIYHHIMFQELYAAGYTDLLIQSGSSEFNSDDFRHRKLQITHYKYKPSIEQDICASDLVISHAGMETLPVRYDVAFITTCG